MFGDYATGSARHSRSTAPIGSNSMLRIHNKPALRFGLSLLTRRVLVLILWAVLICCVVIGSLSPAASPIMVAVGRLHVNDNVVHFCAYLALSILPVFGFTDRRRGRMVGRSMFLFGIFME